jgi:surface polysaccharide O-acyltransferase-like enzyme
VSFSLDLQSECQTFFDTQKNDRCINSLYKLIQFFNYLEAAFPKSLSVTTTFPQKEKFDFIDLLKAIASYLVVIYHYNYIDFDFVAKEGTLQYLNYFVLTFLPVSVPIFFFVNGALLLNKRELEMKRHIFKIVDFIVLVIVWGVITFVFISLLHHQEIEFTEVVKSLYELKQGWTNHLWFLEALVIIYIFYPVLYTAFHQKPVHFYFFLVAAFIFTLGNTFISHVLTVISLASESFPEKDFNINFFSGFNPFVGMYGYSIPYFMLGGVVIRYRDQFKTSRLRILSSIAIPLAMLIQFLYGIVASLRQHEVWDCVWNGHDTIPTLVMVLSLFILLLPYKHHGLTGKIITLIAQNSLGIYFLHVIVAEFASIILFNPNANDFFLNALSAFGILAISLFIAVILKKIPVLKYLVSIA